MVSLRCLAAPPFLFIVWLAFTEFLSADFLGFLRLTKLLRSVNFAIISNPASVPGHGADFLRDDRIAKCTVSSTLSSKSEAEARRGFRELLRQTEADELRKEGKYGQEDDKKKIPQECCHG